MVLSISSDYRFTWDGPRSILIWAGQIFFIIVCGILTCFECVFCGRWRDLLPLERVDYEARERCGKEFRRELAPLPLTRPRPRALTLPLSIAPEDADALGLREGSQSYEKETAAASQVTHHQSQSFFCARFPLEVRLMVYEHVISDYGQGHVFHILAKERRLGFWRCRRSADGEPCDWSWPCCPEWLPYKDSWRWALQTGEKKGWERAIETDGGILPLAMSCRMIYTEFLPLIYSTTTFHFPDPGSIPNFCNGIPPHRLSLIQRLNLNWEGQYSIFNPDDSCPQFDMEEIDAWRAAWSCISQMSCLKELRVRLKTHQFLHWKEVSAVQYRQWKMCESLMQIKIPSLRVFLLEVEWDEAILRRQLDPLLDGDEVPFVITQVKAGRRPALTGSVSASTSDIDI